MSSEINKSRVSVYPSAVDLWIGVMLAMTPCAAVAMGVYLVWIGQPADASVMFMTASLTLLATMAFTVPCRYTLLDDAASVRCGLICYQIPYDTIKTVEPSATLRSGPALSLRRVLVKTDKRSHILSPKNRDQFIEELTKRIHA